MSIPLHTLVASGLQAGDATLEAGSRPPRRYSAGHLNSEAATTAYLKVMAANTARDYFKAKHSEKRGFELLSNGVRLGEIASSNGTDSDREILFTQIDSALDADERDRTVFWLYYRQGLTARESLSFRPSG